MLITENKDGNDVSNADQLFVNNKFMYVVGISFIIACLQNTKFICGSNSDLIMLYI